MRNPSSRTKTFSSRLGDAILSVLAVAGGLSIILVILGFSMNVSIMMFRTGSMEPTIPTGSIAMVREIPATDMVEGDVITVDRGDELLPITHRVTEMLDVDEASGAVTFVMRGDANDTDDPEPYTATTVQRAFFSVPGVAPFIQSLQSPFVLGGLTLGATALVIWAFWPRDVKAVPAIPKPRGAHAAHGYVLPVVIALMAPMLMSENITTEEISGEYIRLQSSGDREEMTNMAPGQPATWAVDVWVDAPEPGLVDLELSAVGALAAHPEVMATEIIVCTPHPAVVTECHPDAEQERKVVDTSQLVDDSSEQLLGSMRSDETRRVLVTATLADSLPQLMQSASANFRFTAHGYDETLSASPSTVTAGDAHTSKEIHADLVDTDEKPPGSLANTGLRGFWIVSITVLLLAAGVFLKARSARNVKTHAEVDETE